MKTTFRYSFLFAALTGLLAAGNLWAQTEAEEKQLQATETEVEKDVSGSSQETRVQALADQYNVDASVVENLRAEGRGWGEINTELAMAQHLSKTDAATYPTLGDALTKIESQRDDGMGWGAIAKDSGFKLGPVVSASRHARDGVRADLRAATRQDKVERKMDRVNRPDRPERPDRAGRPERPEKPDHPARGNR